MTATLPLPHHVVERATCPCLSFLWVLLGLLGGLQAAVQRITNLPPSSYTHSPHNLSQLLQDAPALPTPLPTPLPLPSNLTRYLPNTRPEQATLTCSLWSTCRRAYSALRPLPGGWRARREGMEELWWTSRGPSF